MDTYRQPEQVISPAVHTDIDAPSVPRKGGFFHTVFSTNWGLVLIGALVAIGLGVSALHADYTESNTSEARNAEIESTVAR